MEEVMLEYKDKIVSLQNANARHKEMHDQMLKNCDRLCKLRIKDSS